MTSSMSEVMQVIQRYMPQGFMPKVGMILGSGLSALGEQITSSVSIPYQALPGFEVGGGVAGHAYQLVLGYLGDVPVACLRGRIHLYEGISYEPMRILVRILKQLGCTDLIVTGAAGSLRAEVGAGEMMMITDHINMLPINPLQGPNDESIGPRFIGMENAYDINLQESMVRAANRINLPLAQGVYISTLGPSFETPAEIRAFRTLGADAVGMSVVPEVILARHCGLRVAGIAAITNLASGMSNESLTHEGTLQFGEMAARKMTKLVPEFVKEIQSVMA